MAWRIGASKIIDRLDDAAPEQVKPQPIDCGPREKGVIRTGQPARQDLAPIGKRRDGRNQATQKFRRNHLACPRLDNFPLSSRKDGLLLVINLNEERPIPILQAGEKGGEAIVIILGPALARMVVAAGALQADAEKKLSDFLVPRQRIVQPTVERGRGTTVIAATRGQDAANELVF